MGEGGLTGDDLMNDCYIGLTKSKKMIMAAAMGGCMSLPHVGHAAPAPKAATKAVATTPAKRIAATQIATPAGLRYLPEGPLLIGLVQLNAAENFFGMITGGAQNDDAADAMKGMLMLLKDQMDGPLAVAMYADKTGKPESVVMAARLKQAALTRELLNGVTMLQGGDENKGPQKSVYKGQNLFTMEIPQQANAPKVPIPLQPTYSLLSSDFLVVGTTLDAVKRSIDSGTEVTGGLVRRADVAAMMKEFPPTGTADVWLMIPKPSGNLPANVKLPLPIPIASLPIGATVMTVRFTSSGVRFEGLASVDRSAKTAQKP
jgi:hypothetical protein